MGQVYPDGAARRVAGVRVLRSRAVRLKLAAVLAAFAAAGLFASSQARAQVPEAFASNPGASGCNGGQVRWGYEVGLIPGADRGFSIEGIRVDSVPAPCVGVPVEITYLSGSRVVRHAVRPLFVGVVDRLDRSATGDVLVTAASWAPMR